MRAPRWARLDDPRRRRTRVGLLALTTLVIGTGAGLALRPDPGPFAAQRYQERVAPLVTEVDAWWVSGREDRPPLLDVLDALRNGGDVPTPAQFEALLEAHDTLLVRIVGVELPLEARGAQRQAVLAVTLSRDAAEVLQRAASASSGSARSDLVLEAARLRLRSEQVAGVAAATIDELAGSRRRLAPLPSLPRFPGAGA